MPKHENGVTSSFAPQITPVCSSCNTHCDYCCAACCKNAQSATKRNYVTSLPSANLTPEGEFYCRMCGIAPRSLETLPLCKECDQRFFQWFDQSDEEALAALADEASYQKHFTLGSKR